MAPAKLTSAVLQQAITDGLQVERCTHCGRARVFSVALRIGRCLFCGERYNLGPPAAILPPSEPILGRPPAEKKRR